MPDESPVAQDRVERFRAAYWARLSAPLRRFAWAGALTATSVAALIAREGTIKARCAAAGLVLLTAAFFAYAYVRRGRQTNDLARALAQIAKPSDPVAGERSIRALRLWKQTQNSPHAGSPALAESFMLAALASISTEAVETRARRFARVLEIFAVVCFVTTFALVIRAGHEILEGLDVALARAGRAPIPMLWLEVTSVSAQPPAYLRMAEHSILFGSHVVEPTGTLISVRGLPLRNDIDLVLTNGQQLVDFVQSTDGELVAHWTLNHTERLSIAARFGPTTIVQDEMVVIEAQPDELPEVWLENEGGTVQLGHVPRVELNYRALDDHGLRQIDLVLQSVDREDRRTLMRLDGQQREQTGAYALSAADSLLKGVRLPTLVRVEARDDNVLAPNNWGHSGWIRLEPPMPGQPEAERVATLRQLRDRALKWLSVARSLQSLPGDREETLAKSKAAATDALAESLSTEHESWQWPAHVELLLKALKERLSRSDVQAPGSSTIEQAALALDSLVVDLGEHDARVVSVALAELADDVVLGAQQAGGTEFRTRGERRVNEALVFLNGGAQSLRELGSLGLDLSNIVRAAVTRIQRAREAHDFTHAQLAAEYLAARLRRPEPSAGSLPTSGVEAASGDSPGMPRPQQSASNAHQRIERLLMELQQLRQEHRSSLELLERTLKSSDVDTPSGENDQRAARLRGLAEKLPYMGADLDSALSLQVVAREQSLGAAESMRRNQVGDALERERAARDAIREAVLRTAREGATSGVDEKVLRQLDDELASQSRALEQVLQQNRKEAGRRAAEQLRDQIGNEHQLARRARALAQREQRRDSVIPEALRHDLARAAEFMDWAGDALEKSDGTVALDHEQRAQALLDRGDSQQKKHPAEPMRDDGRSKSSPMTNQGTVTPTGDPEAAARFRARVQRGLSAQAPGELSSAVRRYAEGLLR